VDHVQEKLAVSERRACRVLSQPRATQRHRARVRKDEPRLVARIIELARQYGRYGYRRITAFDWRQLFLPVDDNYFFLFVFPSFFVSNVPPAFLFAWSVR
jgi:hypothetical protein